MTRKQLGGLLIIIAALIWSQGGGGINPFVPVDPSPIETKARMALIVYESSELSKYPHQQVAAFRGEPLHNYLTEKCDKDEDGHPLFRIWDKDVDQTHLDQVWKDALNVPRDTLPWLIATNGEEGFSGPMPRNTEATIELLKKYME